MVSSELQINRGERLMEKIDVPIDVPEGVSFPEYKDKYQLKRWILAACPDSIPNVCYNHS